MVAAKPIMTLEEYLNYDDGSDHRYELVSGELVRMPPESPRNARIALFLLSQLLRIVSLERLSHKDLDIVVSGSRATTRLPDLMVLSEELAAELETATRGTILLDMPPPILVVEVVSPGKENEDRDYRYKRSEYAARGIQEYWIVDPMKKIVTLLTLVDGFYETQVLQGNDRLISGVLPELSLSVEEIFQV
ncbi:MAG: Uma2 family endonuclease [Leptolyngbyaceae cyanobacterium MO_188.B28]|nr:Uma2 family endonuclease [Leptolyngbyaceae cyanobacterium MO_188.B28]